MTSSCLPRLSHSNFAAIRRESLREWDNKSNIFRVTKQSGLDLDKESRSSGRGGAFFLTSLFIELIDRIRVCKGLFGHALACQAEVKWSNLGPTTSKEGAKRKCKTQNQPKRTNHIALVALPLAQGVRGSNPRAPTNTFFCSNKSRKRISLPAEIWVQLGSPQS